MRYVEDLPAVPFISALEFQPRTFITLTPSRVPIDVEQALFSVTDVSLAVQNPHFPSISNGQVSACTSEEGPFQGTSDRQRQKSTSLAQSTYYDNAERFRKCYNFLLTRKKNWGLGSWRRSARKDQRAENSCLAIHSSFCVQSCTISILSFELNYCMLLALMKHRDQLLAKQIFHPLSPSSCNQVKWFNPNNDDRGTENGCMLRPNKVPLQLEPPDPVKVFLL